MLVWFLHNSVYNLELYGHLINFVNILFHFLELWWLSSRTYQLKEPKYQKKKKNKSDNKIKKEMYPAQKH